MHRYISVVTTTDRPEVAEAIARSLVERRLAACVQVTGPVTSVYRWKGNIETASEWQCTAKTRRELYARVEEAIRQSHNYETPEILASPIIAGSSEYLTWIDEQTHAPEA